MMWMTKRRIHGAIGIALICLLLDLSSLLPQDTLQSTRESRTLNPGSALDREISAGQVHEYPVTASSGTFLRFLVDKSNQDLTATLWGPAGKKLREATVSGGSYIPLLVSHIAEEPGVYRLEVRLDEGPLGKSTYLVGLTEVSPATDRHRDRVMAERLLEEADNADWESEEESRSAVQAREEAVLLSRGAGDDTLLSNALTVAAFAHNTLGDLEKALAFLRQRQQLEHAHNEPVREADTLVMMSSFARTRGGLQVVLDSALQAMDLYNAFGGWDGKINALLTVGYAYQNLRDPARAAEAFEKASGFNPLGNGKNFLSTAAGLYYGAGQLQKAVDCYETAAKNAAASGVPSFQANWLLQAARIYVELGQSRKAIGHVNQALSFWQSEGAPQPDANALWLLGIIYHGLADRQASLEYLDRAFARAAQSNPNNAGLWSNLGTAYGQNGERRKARACYDEALKIARRQYNPWPECRALALIAMDERDQGNLTAARALIEQALTGLETLRGTIASPDIRSDWFAKSQKFYEFYIDLLMRLDPEKPAEGFRGAALQATERARARSLLELLSEGDVDIRRGVDSALLDKERFINRRLNTRANDFRALLRLKHTPQQEEDLTREIDRLTAELREVEGRIRAASPHYAAMAMPSPLGPKEIQQQVLDPETLLLEYALGEERSYLFVVSRDSLNAFTLPPRAELQTAAQELYELLTARNRRPAGEPEAARRIRLEKAQAEYPRAAERLSRMVLEPAAPLLGARRLVIVPAGMLQYVPFSALPDPGSSSSGESGRWLLENHEIVYLPSASVLAALRQEISARKPALGAVAVLADPVFDKDDARVGQYRASGSGKPDAAVSGSDAGRSAAGDEKPSALLDLSLRNSDPEPRGRLQRLPFSRREAEAIGAITPNGQGFVALDFRASRLTATSRELSRYRIVHFATHALVDSRNPALSGIVLSLVDESGAPQDGFLRLHDIFNLKLPAELVVLSACQTALGKDVEGEGLIGLTRGFLYAGAARVAASLWNVDDPATAELMSRFYRSMLSGNMRPTAALRAAQLEMSRQKRWQDPYYWASFQLQGEWK